MALFLYSVIVQPGGPKPLGLNGTQGVFVVPSAGETPPAPP